MQDPAGTNYATVDQSYFDKRGLNAMPAFGHCGPWAWERLFPDISPAGIWA